MKFERWIGAAAALSLAWGAAGAIPVRIPVDPAQSTITVRLTLLGSSAQDTSPIEGYYDMVLNSEQPTTLGLTDFRLVVLEDLVLNINYGTFFGRFDSTARNLVVYDPQPGLLIGPEPIDGDQWQLFGVPTAYEGAISYRATLLVCASLQSAGYACEDSIDLSEFPQGTSDPAGTITVAGGVVTIAASIDVTTPLDPDNPGLGSIRVQATIRGSAPIPPSCPADFNGDGQVDFFDYLDFVQAFASDHPSADFNGDGQVDFFDYLDFVQAFAQGCE